MEKNANGSGTRKLNRLQEFALAKKMESMKAHIFEDKPTIAAFTQSVSEDLGFLVSRRTVGDYFKILWPDKKWPGKRQCKPRANGTVYARLRNHDELIAVISNTLNTLLNQLGENELRLKFLDASQAINIERVA